MSASSLVRCAMPKPLPLTDFRSRRTVLVRSDFGYAPKQAPRPSDIIDEETWDSIVTLPDDVAVRTTNYHGTTIRQLHDLWGAGSSVLERSKTACSQLCSKLATISKPRPTLH